MVFTIKLVTLYINIWCKYDLKLHNLEVYFCKISCCRKGTPLSPLTSPHGTSCPFVFFYICLGDWIMCVHNIYAKQRIFFLGQTNVEMCIDDYGGY